MKMKDRLTAGTHSQLFERHLFLEKAAELLSPTIDLALGPSIWFQHDRFVSDVSIMALGSSERGWALRGIHLHLMGVAWQAQTMSCSLPADPNALRKILMRPDHDLLEDVFDGLFGEDNPWRKRQGRWWNFGLIKGALERRVQRLKDIKGGFAKSANNDKASQQTRDRAAAALADLLNLESRLDRHDLDFDAFRAECRLRSVGVASVPSEAEGVPSPVEAPSSAPSEVPSSAPHLDQRAPHTAECAPHDSAPAVHVLSESGSLSESESSKAAVRARNAFDFFLERSGQRARAPTPKEAKAIEWFAESGLCLKALQQVIAQRCESSQIGSFVYFLEVPLPERAPPPDCADSPDQSGVRIVADCSTWLSAEARSRFDTQLESSINGFDLLYAMQDQGLVRVIFPGEESA